MNTRMMHGMISQQSSQSSCLHWSICRELIPVS